MNLFTRIGSGEGEYPNIPDNKLKEIYHAMISRFPENQEIEMARFSLAMNEAGFNCKSLGYPKMKFMLSKMQQFIGYRTDPNSSVSDLLVTLHRVPEWATQEQSEQDADLSRKMNSAEKGRNEWDILPASKFGPLSAEQLAKLPESFSGIRLTVAAQNSLLGFISGTRIQGMTALMDVKQLEQLSRDYREAKTANLFRPNDHSDGAVDFPTHFRALQGDLLFLTLAPTQNENDRFPWYSSFCGKVFNTSVQPGEHGAPAALKLPARFSEETVNLRAGALSAMHCYTEGLLFDPNRILKPTFKEMQALEDSYDTARQEQRLFPSNNGYVFLTTLRTPNHQQLQVEIVPEYQSGKWVLCQIKPAVPKSSLERFAYMGSWDWVLKQLEGKALAEHWSFGHREDRRILQGYLRYTFYRLECEGKVLKSEDGQYAAFNTGLVDESYDDIFAVFVPQEPFNGVLWKFCTFCVKSESPWGKELVKTFNPLPKRAEYFRLSNASDLLYDDSCPLSFDKDHIIVKRIYRWPLDVLERDLTEPDMESVLEQIKSAIECSNKEQIKKGFEKLQGLLGNNSMFVRRLQECLNAAIIRARKRVRWNYQTALPCYFPTGNTMSLMLPLDLTGAGRIDFALVVDRQKNGTYIGQTVLTLDQAYVDARLVCRPDKDWLNNEQIENALEAEEDDSTGDPSEAD